MELFILQWKDTPVEQLMESKLKCVFDVDPEMLQVFFIMLFLL